MKKTIFLLAIFLLFPKFVLASPSISGISGNVSHNSVITVNGSGFGVKSPVAPAKYDSVDGMYVGLSDGDEIPRENNCPWNPNSACPWNDPGGSESETPVYDTVNYRGKLRASYSNKSRLNTDGNATVGAYMIPSCSSTKVMYLSFWLKPHTALDGSVAGGSNSNKFWRLGEDVLGPDNDITYILATSGQNYIYNPDVCHALAPDFDGYCSNEWDGPSWSYGWAGLNNWHRLETAVKNYDGVNKTLLAIWRDNAPSGGHAISETTVDDICMISTLGTDFSNGAAPQPQMEFGEIYADSTLARVEICNANTKAGSNHCEIQIPETIWNNGQLQSKVNQGSFADNSFAYLYVLDSAGTANADGFQITFGSGSPDTTAPTAPTALYVL